MTDLKPGKPNPAIDALFERGWIIPTARSMAGMTNIFSRVYSTRFDEAIRHYAENARSMRNDTFLTALLLERTRPLLGWKWEVVLDEDNPKGSKEDPAAEELRQQAEGLIRRTPRFHEMRDYLSDYLWYGRYGSQVLYGDDTVGGYRRRVIVAHEPVDGDNILPTFDGHPALAINPLDRGYYLDKYGEDSITYSDRFSVLRLNRPDLRQRFIIQRHHVRAGDYFWPETGGRVGGFGLRHQVYWTWFLRQQMLESVTNFMDKVGTLGLLLFYYEEGNDESKRKAEQSAVDASNRNALAVPVPKGKDPKTAGVDAIPANMNGVQFLVEFIERYFERHIERLFVGQAASASSEGDSLGGNSADFQKDTKYQLLRSDAEATASGFTEDMLNPLIGENFPGIPWRYRFKFVLPDPDAAKKLEAANKAYSMGVSLDMDEVRGLTGLSKPDDGANVLQQQQPGAMGGLPGMPGMGGPDAGSPVPGGDAGPDGGAAQPQNGDQSGAAQPQNPVPGMAELVAAMVGAGADGDTDAMRVLAELGSDPGALAGFLDDGPQLAGSKLNYSWNESQHPRDESGQFAAKAERAESASKADALESVGTIHRSYGPHPKAAEQYQTAKQNHDSNPTQQTAVAVVEAEKANMAALVAEHSTPETRVAAKQAGRAMQAAIEKRSKRYEKIQSLQAQHDELTEPQHPGYPPEPDQPDRPGDIGPAPVRSEYDTDEDYQDSLEEYRVAAENHRRELEQYNTAQAEYESAYKAWDRETDRIDRQHDRDKDRYEAKLAKIAEKIDELTSDAESEFEDALGDAYDIFDSVFQEQIAAEIERLREHAESDDEPQQYALDSGVIDYQWTAAQTKNGGVKAVWSGDGQRRALYGEAARRALANQSKQNDGQAAPQTPQQKAQELKQQREPGRQEARESWRAAIENPASVRPEQLAGLADQLSRLTRDELQQMARDLNQRVSGLKTDLVQRLREYAASRGAGQVTPEEQTAVKSELSQSVRPDGTPVNPTVQNVYTVDPKSLKTDPKRFQYKVSGIKADGVSDELRGVKSWNPALGGTLLVWRDPADGQDYVVNGHHRHELAARTGAESINVRYLEADSPKVARAAGALANIAEGRGTALDAAKFMRDTGSTPEDLQQYGISLSGRVASDAVHLRDLSDKAFQQLTNGVISEDQAAAVAKHLKDHALQDLLFKRLQQRENDGKEWGRREIGTAARKLAQAGKVTEKTENLFGAFEDEKSTFDQEVELESHIGRVLGQRASDYAALSSQKRANRVAGAGNVLAVDENQRRKQQAESAVEDFDRESGLKSPISQIIQDHAAQLFNAKTRKERDAIKQSALEAVERTIAGADATGKTAIGSNDAGAAATPKSTATEQPAASDKPAASPTMSTPTDRAAEPHR